MNELAMSHILNAEAEKMQAFVKYAERSLCVKTKEFIQFNNAVSKFMEEVTMEQWLGLNKLDRVIQLIDEHYDDTESEDCINEDYDNLEEYCDE